MSGWATAVGFYTRIPVRSASVVSGDLAAAAPWFPVVGLGVGAVVAGTYIGLAELLPNLLAATIAAAAGALLTGALHEDGLADVADSFAGGSTIERRLEILEDPRLGTFGVIALVASFLVRVSAVAVFDASAALAVIPAAHALSRVPAVVLMRRQPAARTAGLAVALAAGIGPAQEAAAVAIGTVACALLIGVWSIPAVAAAALVAAALAALARARIGGVNGDVLGATQQLVELSVLLLGVAVVERGWEIAWWAA